MMQVIDFAVIFCGRLYFIVCYDSVSFLAAAARAEKPYSWKFCPDVSVWCLPTKSST